MLSLAACDVAGCGNRQLCVLWIAPLDRSVRGAREAREAESLVGHDEVLAKVPSLTVPQHRVKLIGDVLYPQLPQLLCDNLLICAFGVCSFTFGNSVWGRACCLQLLSETKWPSLLLRVYTAYSYLVVFGAQKNTSNIALPPPSSTSSCGSCR